MSHQDEQKRKSYCSRGASMYSSDPQPSVNGIDDNNLERIGPRLAVSLSHIGFVDPPNQRTIISILDQSVPIIWQPPGLVRELQCESLNCRQKILTSLREIAITKQSQQSRLPSISLLFGVKPFTGSNGLLIQHSVVKNA